MTTIASATIAASERAASAVVVARTVEVMADRLEDACPGAFGRHDGTT